MVNRLLRKIRTGVVAGRDKRPERQRYSRGLSPDQRALRLRAHRSATRCRIGKVRYVQPRQHAVLGHSELILEQMRQVDRTVRKWLRREFGAALTRRATGRPRSRGLGAWRGTISCEGVRDGRDALPKS